MGKLLRVENRLPVILREGPRALKEDEKDPRDFVVDVAHTEYCGYLPSKVVNAMRHKLKLMAEWGTKRVTGKVQEMPQIVNAMGVD